MHNLPSVARSVDTSEAEKMLMFTFYTQRYLYYVIIICYTFAAWLSG